MFVIKQMQMHSSLDTSELQFFEIYKELLLNSYIDFDCV